jgi:predicted nucleotidyltransferase
MRYLELCERFIDQEFPDAEIAVVAGSTARGNRTPSSDIDVLIVGDDLFADESTSLAATFSFGGEVFEVFAYTHDGFSEWADRGISDHRPVIVHMLVEGHEVRGGEALSALRDRWGETLADGPIVSEHEIAMRRYGITDLLDDLRDSGDDLERNVIAWSLFEKVAELMLLTERRWVGTGKYLPRRLRELSPDRADSLSSPLLQGDLQAFAASVEGELSRAGGRVHEGFVR